MKNITKIFAVAGALLAMASCNKATFVNPDFVSFNTNRVNAAEDAGIIAIPVNLYGAEKATITYQVVSETAIAAGEAMPEKVKETINKNYPDMPQSFFDSYYNYTICDKNGNENKTGVLTVSKEENYIYVKINNYKGTYTGNVSFSVIIKDVVEEGIQKGSFTTCKVTVIDADGGLGLLLGHWYGDGADFAKNGSSLEFDLDEFDVNDPANANVKAVYPEANVVFQNLLLAGGDMDAQADLYGKFDENTSKIILYGAQFFNAYNFGSIGVNYVGLAADNSSAKGDVVFSCDEATLVLDASMSIYLYSYETGAYGGYYYEKFNSGMLFIKK